MFGASGRPLLPFCGSVLGIDVGWSTRERTTAVCCLSWDGGQVDWKILRCLADEEDKRETLDQVVGDRQLLAAAIDGPLRRGLDDIEEYRSAERLLSRGRLARRIGKPSQSSSANGRLLNEQANTWATIVEDSGRVARSGCRTTVTTCRIVEAFPTSFLGVLIEAPEPLTSKCRSDVYFIYLALWRSLDTFLMLLNADQQWKRLPSQITNHDDRAAFVCALTALCVAAGWYVAVGDDEYGWIHLPPKCMIRPWALEALAQNTKREKEEKGSTGLAVSLERGDERSL